MKQRLLSLKRGDIKAIVISLILGIFFLFAAFKFPDAFRTTGFGPDWNCSSKGSMCIKKPSANSNDRTAP